MKNTVLIVVLLLSFTTEAQMGLKRMKKKVSYAEGTLFGYWGYNRSGYTKSNIRFVGPGYDFTLKGSRSHDNPERFDPSVYFNPSKLTIPQFNYRLGYYFKDHWAISLGQDHMKYIFADRNQVLLSGEIKPGVDTVTNWSGIYNGEPVTTERSKFHYENSDGLNYLRIELTRTDQWLTVGERNWFAIATNIGVGLGGLLSFNDFRFGTDGTDIRTISMSGYGISAHASVRLEFLRHVFLQSGFSGGFHHQIKVKTRPNDPSSYARQAYGYYDFNTVLGFLFYIRPKNGCDSCPVW